MPVLQHLSKEYEVSADYQMISPAISMSYFLYFYRAKLYLFWFHWSYKECVKYYPEIPIFLIELTAIFQVILDPLAPVWVLKYPSKTIPKSCRGMNTFELILWSHQHLDTKTTPWYYRKSTLQTNIMDEHRRKTSQQNPAKLNPTIH